MCLTEKQRKYKAEQRKQREAEFAERQSERRKEVGNAIIEQLKDIAKPKPKKNWEAHKELQGKLEDIRMAKEYGIDVGDVSDFCGSAL